jgi:hypothetical protein
MPEHVEPGTKESIVETAQNLGPHQRAALVVVSDEGDVIVEDARGGEWWDIAGLFCAGVAYCQSEMKLPKT